MATFADNNMEHAMSVKGRYKHWNKGMAFAPGCTRCPSCVRGEKKRTEGLGWVEEEGGRGTIWALTPEVNCSIIEQLSMSGDHEIFSSRQTATACISQFYLHCKGRIKSLAIRADVWFHSLFPSQWGCSKQPLGEPLSSARQKERLQCCLWAYAITNNHRPTGNYVSSGPLRARIGPGEKKKFQARTVTPLIDSVYQNAIDLVADATKDSRRENLLCKKP